MAFSAHMNEWLTPQGSTFTALVVSSVFKYLWIHQARGARDTLFTLVGHVAEMYVHPIKSCGSVELKSAMATVFGLTANGYYDRRWLIVTADTGQVVNIRMQPRLLLVKVSIDGDWCILTAPDMEPLRLPAEPDPAKYQHKTARVSTTQIRALDCGKEANDWFSRYLGQPVILLHSRPSIGARDAHDAVLMWETDSKRGDKSVFAYLTSYLLTTTASLSEVNGCLENPVTSRNFRPNIVVDSSLPFDEDNWDEILIGTTAKFHYVQPCRRCMITTVHPDTAKRREDNQPLAALKTYRQRSPYGIAPLYGAYIAVDCMGPINVGDPVYAIRRQTARF